MSEDHQEFRRDLTKFQTRALAVVASGDGMHGLAIKEELEDYYESEVNHGRLYPNLDDLVEQGLVEKSELDGRTNEYAITADGQSFLESELDWLTNASWQTAGQMATAADGGNQTKR